LSVDVRVLSGTHKDLKHLVAAGQFREDLFYRLNVVPIRVPSLRERPEDIPLLAAFFAERLCAKNNLRHKQIDDEVLWELKHYPWPGNVRELENVLERIVIMSGDRIGVADLPEEIVATGDGPNDTTRAATLKAFRDQAEREYILKTLQRNGGNITQAALELGVRRTYLHRRLVQLKIEKTSYFK